MGCLGPVTKSYQDLPLVNLYHAKCLHTSISRGTKFCFPFIQFVFFQNNWFFKIFDILILNFKFNKLIIVIYDNVHTLKNRSYRYFIYLIFWFKFDLNFIIIIIFFYNNFISWNNLRMIYRLISGLPMLNPVTNVEIQVGASLSFSIKIQEIFNLF